MQNVVLKVCISTILVLRIEYSVQLFRSNIPSSYHFRPLKTVLRVIVNSRRRLSWGVLSFVVFRLTGEGVTDKKAAWGTVKEGVDVCNMIRMEASLLEGEEDNQFDEDVVKDEKMHANEVGEGSCKEVSKGLYEVNTKSSSKYNVSQPLDNLECKLCHTKFSLWKNYQRHKKEVYDDNPWNLCEICGNILCTSSLYHNK
jgi:hypothetical protein